MSASYKLVKRVNPMKRDEPGKWYATPNSNPPLTGKAMTRAATANTTTAPVEMEASLELLAKFVPGQLQQGHTVQVPGLGTFRLIYKSDGVDNPDDFRAATMIHDIRIAFTPCPELRESVLKELTFVDGGILEGGVSYATLADYRKAKAAAAGNTDQGGDQGEAPQA